MIGRMLRGGVLALIAIYAYLYIPIIILIVTLHQFAVRH